MNYEHEKCNILPLIGIRLQNLLPYTFVHMYLISDTDIIKEAFRATSSSNVVINVSAASHLRSNNIGLKMLIRQATWCQNLKQSVHNSGFPLLTPLPPLSTQSSFRVHSYFGFYYLDDIEEDMSTNESISPHSSLEL